MSYDEATVYKQECAILRAKVEELERDTHKPTVSYWMNMFSEMQKEAKKRFDDWFVLSQQLDALAAELVVERNNGRILNEVTRELGEGLMLTPLEKAKQLKQDLARVTGERGKYSGHHPACAPSGYTDTEGTPQPPVCHPECFVQLFEIEQAQLTAATEREARLREALTCCERYLSVRYEDGEIHELAQAALKEGA